jgi:hypothetical protein
MVRVGESAKYSRVPSGLMHSPFEMRMPRTWQRISAVPSTE